MAEEEEEETRRNVGQKDGRRAGGRFGLLHGGGCGG